jgi:hypothetical protein
LKSDDGGELDQLANTTVTPFRVPEKAKHGRKPIILLFFCVVRLFGTIMIIVIFSTPPVMGR